MTTLDMLAKEIRSINAANGWNVIQVSEWSKEYKVLALLALIHSEVSEAVEAVRHDDIENFLEEMADVLIRVLDCVGGFGSGFDKIVADKLEKNRNRGYRHGGKRV
jgi:NTP pyrophosphatase (non-canonical NTP hydrolase)